MRYPVIIIGAGPSGLSVAHYLQEMSIEFIIFEKGGVGNSWRTQRWEHMVLNTPNSMNYLPGMDLNITDSDNFMTAKEFLIQLEEYAAKRKFNIVEHAIVKDVRKDSNGINEFIVQVEVAGKMKIYRSSVVIAASGAHVQKVTPEFSYKVPSRIMQLHSSEFKSTSILNEGAVLVVDSGQSGMQITRELLKERRKVFLSTSEVGRIPREYRGRDIEFWLQETGFYSEEIKDDTRVYKSDLIQPQIAVTDKKGMELGWGYLVKNGVELIGTLKDVDENNVFFDDNVIDNINFGLEFVCKIQSMIDKHITNAGLIGIPNHKTSSIEINKRNVIEVIGRDFIDFVDKNITNIIWTTGLKANYDYLSKSIYNLNKRPYDFQDEAPVGGLYFLGIPFQRTRKSGIVLGIVEDAKFIAEEVKEKLRF